jgi:hypothetical protein
VKKAKSVSERMHTRPGVELVHTFRSHVVSMTNYQGRILVVLESGKAYRSNAKGTRWYRINGRTSDISSEG